MSTERREKKQDGKSLVKLVPISVNPALLLFSFLLFLLLLLVLVLVLVLLVFFLFLFLGPVYCSRF